MATGFLPNLFSYNKGFGHVDPSNGFHLGDGLDFLFTKEVKASQLINLNQLINRLVEPRDREIERCGFASAEWCCTSVCRG
jgi:hypothetical protein